ncbi:unnamed protein product [Ranitomeya imitator]|uniref:Aspartate dehydrogenase domain-containing protein n=1 Tax=Ranitomeya imitator TaxID=111125 RepID=A0ABN9LZA2_9NEOB|nr:unnamed protein product [Ranitomeya imitator]
MHQYEKLRRLLIFQGLKITMTKHPQSFKLEGKLSEKDLSAIQDRTILYEGPIRQLCPMAPNNVNTMAAASLAAHTLGFDEVIGVLVADPSIPDWHIVDIEVTGATNETTGQVFTVRTSRRNPAAPGAVTGAATFVSFWSSILVMSKHLNARVLVTQTKQVGHSDGLNLSNKYKTYKAYADNARIAKNKTPIHHVNHLYTIGYGVIKNPSAHAVEK